MNSDSLEQLWQQQPLPPAQAYRKLQDRSWVLRQDVDRFDGLGAIMISASSCLLFGLIGAVTGDADWLHWVFLIIGTAWLGWAGRAKWQRRRLRHLTGEDLLREVDLVLMRVHQNLVFNRRMTWVVPPLMIAAGAWIFWPQGHAYRATTMGDWIWSGSFIAMWVVFAAWSVWSARKRRRAMNDLHMALTELRASLLVLGDSGTAD